MMMGLDSYKRCQSVTQERVGKLMVTFLNVKQIEVHKSVTQILYFSRYF